MGRLGLVVVALSSQGCVYLEGLEGGGELGLHSLSTLYADARGLELTPDGAAGLLGMNTTTCALDSAWGSTGSDYDVAGVSDTVASSDCGPDSDCDYAVVSGDRVTLVEVDASSWGSVAEDRRFEGLVGVALVEGGLAALSDRDGACIVEFAGRRSMETRASVAMPAEACDDAVVERGAGAALFVASAGGIWSVDSEGRERIADPAGQLAWDPVSAVLYAADRDGTELRALEADGASLWEESLGGTVVAFDDAGDRSGALVMVEDGVDEGRILLLDGATSERVMEEVTPGVARAVRSSADGGTVALLRDGEVSFFTLDDGIDLVDDAAIEVSFEGFGQ